MHMKKSIVRSQSIILLLTGACIFNSGCANASGDGDSSPDESPASLAVTYPTFSAGDIYEYHSGDVTDYLDFTEAAVETHYKNTRDEAGRKETYDYNPSTGVLTTRDRSETGTGRYRYLFSAGGKRYHARYCLTRYSGSGLYALWTDGSITVNGTDGNTITATYADTTYTITFTDDNGWLSVNAAAGTDTDSFTCAYTSNGKIYVGVDTITKYN